MCPRPKSSRFILLATSLCSKYQGVWLPQENILLPVYMKFVLWLICLISAVSALVNHKDLGLQSVVHTALKTWDVLPAPCSRDTLAKSHLCTGPHAWFSSGWAYGLIKWKFEFKTNSRKVLDGKGAVFNTILFLAVELACLCPPHRDKILLFWLMPVILLLYNSIIPIPFSPAFWHYLQKMGKFSFPFPLHPNLSVLSLSTCTVIFPCEK